MTCDGNDYTNFIQRITSIKYKDVIDIDKNKFIDDYQANTTLANERFYTGQLIVWLFNVFISDFKENLQSEF